MSDQLRIAGALRKLDDEALVALAKRRNINTTNLRDFFDFAEQLASEKSIRQILTSFNKEQLGALKQAPAKSAATKAMFKTFLDYLIVDPEQYLPYQTTQDFLDRVEFGHWLAAVDEFVAIENVDQSAIDRDARMQIFELLQAITEVVFDLEQRYIREVGKRSVGLPELKRLAVDLTKPVDFARRVFEIALWADIADVVDGRWQLGDRAEDWLSLDNAGRWKLLAERWVAAFGAANLATLPKLAPSVNLERLLRIEYPLAEDFAASQVGVLASYAESLGLTINAVVTSWMLALQQGDTAKAMAQMAAGLPASDERLIVQADLSMIAPNPLPTQIEIKVRSFAVTEQVGLASTYRLSALSVSSGLEMGLATDEIRDLLTRLSGKELPQPVTYLLQEAERRFGRIRVSNDAATGRTVITSAEPLVITELLNDQKLKALSLHLDENKRLVSRFESDLIYFALRDAGHVAIRVAADGSVISPKAIASRTEKSSVLDRIREDIARMRQADHKIGNEPDDDDFMRQIQLAIKLKSKLKIGVKTSGGKELEFVIEPVGLANGRLRGKDRKADVERTLPLDAIVSIELA